MKVVHIQYAMPPAGNAAYRLHQAMRQAGIDSWMLTLEESAQKDYSTTVPHPLSSSVRKTINALWRIYRKRGLKRGSYFYSNLPLIGNGIYNHPLVKNADVIYLHWIAGGSTAMSDIEGIAKSGKPVIVFLHDMWAFTGGCHYSFECNQFHDGCIKCPMFQANRKSVSAQLKRKVEVYSHYPNISFIAPGEWMYERAIQAMSTRKSRIFRIPNLLDEHVFKPVGKKIARQILNLPLDVPLVTFGCAGGVHNRIKGWNYMRDAVNRIDIDNLEIVVYGCGYDQKAESEISYPVHFLGKLLDDTMISLVCNASDLFVTPSLAENYSLALVENLVVGTPVVAFDHTGNKELVHTGDTGYLARYKDTDDLANGIKSLLEHPIEVKGWRNFRSSDIVKMHENLWTSLM